MQEIEIKYEDNAWGFYHQEKCIYTLTSISRIGLIFFELYKGKLISNEKEEVNVTYFTTVGKLYSKITIGKESTNRFNEFLNLQYFLKHPLHFKNDFTISKKSQEIGTIKVIRNDSIIFDTVKGYKIEISDDTTVYDIIRLICLLILDQNERFIDDNPNL